jgi:glycosyltransferase involved in cell wall biosynthesis
VGDTNPEPVGHIKVAFVMTGDIRPYRIPLLERLVAHPEINLTVFHGPAKEGSGAPDATPELSKNLSDRVIPMRGTRWPFGRRQVAWLGGTWRILAGDSQVIICQETVNNLSIWVFALLHRLFGKKLILHGWGYRADDNASSLSARLRSLARRLLMRTADAMLAYTDRGRLAAVDMGVPPDRTFVSRNTLDTARLSEIEAAIDQNEIRDLRSTLGPTGASVLLFVGRLQSVKRVDVLIEAFGLLRRGGHSCSLIVIGDGPDRPRLEKLAAQLSDVQFLGPIYGERELAPFFLASDLLVVPGRIGLTCVHAFSHGLPVVTASDSVMPQTPEYDFIEDGRNGVIVDTLSAASFSAAIASVVSNRNEHEHLKEGARRSAAELTIDQMVEGFLSAIRFVAR